MKRITMFAVTLALLCGAAFAQDEPEALGLDVGLGIGFGNVADKAVIDLEPEVEYTQSFGALDVYVDAKYTVAFDDPDTQHDVYLEEELAYNLPLGESSVLSFIVNNNNDFYLAPDLNEGLSDDFKVNTIDGTIEPSVKFTQTLDFGDLYGQLGFPISYVEHGVSTEDYEAGAKVKLLLGWASSFGLGVELTGFYAIKPDADYDHTEFLLTYDAEDIWHAEVGFETDKEFSAFTITPEFEYYFNQLTFWAECEFGGIGSDGDVSVTPTIGVKYSF